MHLHSRETDYLDLSNTGALLDDLFDVIERGELVLVGSLGKVANLSDVDVGFAEIVLYKDVSIRPHAS